jgi:hypothetical protein
MCVCACVQERGDLGVLPSPMGGTGWFPGLDDIGK